MKLRYVMTAALGLLVLSCQGPAAVLAQEAPFGKAQRPATGINREGVSAPPAVSVPGDRALERAYRLPPGQTASTVCSMAPKME